MNLQPQGAGHRCPYCGQVLIRDSSRPIAVLICPSRNKCGYVTPPELPTGLRPGAGEVQEEPQ